MTLAEIITFLTETKFRFNDTEAIKLKKLEALREAAVALLAAIEAATWGHITGTLSDQTDLQTALDAKLGLHATADAALILANSRSFTISGDMAWTVSFNGSANVSAAGTLATVNSNTGTYGGATTSPQISVDGKGRITGVTAVTITPAFSSLTSVPTTLAGHNITLTSGNVTTALGYTPVNPSSYGTGVATALAVNTGSAGAFVILGGALGTPSSGNLANCTFPTLNQNTTGSAATLTTTRTIYGQNFNGSANVAGNAIMSVADAAYALAAEAPNGNLRFYPYVDATTGSQIIAFSAGYGGYGKLTFDGVTLRFNISGSLGAELTSSGFAPLSTTTASAANVFQSGSGTVLLRSTSSLRYKRDVRPITPDEADAVLRLRPVRYRSKADADNAEWSWYGLIAEEVAEIDPRLVHWAYAPEDYDRRFKRERRLRKGAKLRPDGVQYERAVVLLLDVVKRDRQAIDDLTARIERLERA